MNGEKVQYKVFTAQAHRPQRAYELLEGLLAEAAIVQYLGGVVLTDDYGDKGRRYYCASQTALVRYVPPALDQAPPSASPAAIQRMWRALRHVASVPESYGTFCWNQTEHDADGEYINLVSDDGYTGCQVCAACLAAAYANTAEDETE